MSRAMTRTKLPLDTWAKLMGIHPLHFNQVRLGDASPHCDQLIFQHEWQNQDHVSREEIAQAIAEAESRIELFLGSRLAPSWEVDEWQPSIAPFQRGMVNLNSSDVRGFNQTVRGAWSNFISGGIQSKDLVQAGATIVYTDADGDGYFETATVTVSTDALDKNEICVFYPDEEGDESWEIRPIEVRIATGVATITFRRESAVIKEKIETYDIEGAEALGEDDDDFLEEVDVYRRYNDPQTQASFLWEPFAGSWCSTCGAEGCSACAYNAQTGCLLVRGDPRLSIIAYHPADWDADELGFSTTSWAMSRQPDIVRLYYYAGVRDKRERYVSRMSPEWERTVAYMAAASLERPPCSCSTGNWEKWRFDQKISPIDGIRRIFFGTDDDQENPFGTRTGEIYAWRKVREARVGQAVVT